VTAVPIPGAAVRRAATTVEQIEAARRPGIRALRQ
jgi:hypothetical protein